MTSASATVRSWSGAVTPKQIPASRSRSSGRPVNVMTGCKASGSAPRRVAGSSTRVPYRPLACTSRRPSSGAPVAASPATRLGSASSGTVSRTRSAAARTAAGCLRGTPGSIRPARSTEASDTAETATTSCPARASAAPRTAPTRPVPMTPTRRRAGCGGLARPPGSAGPPGQPTTLESVEVWMTWRQAMQAALYGPDGFYARGEPPARHFRTSVHVSPRYAAAFSACCATSTRVWAIPARIDLVDVGAGRAELLGRFSPCRRGAGTGPADRRARGGGHAQAGRSRSAHPLARVAAARPSPGSPSPASGSTTSRWTWWSSPRRGPPWSRWIRHRRRTAGAAPGPGGPCLGAGLVAAAGAGRPRRGGPGPVRGMGGGGPPPRPGRRAGRRLRARQGRPARLRNAHRLPGRAGGARAPRRLQGHHGARGARRVRGRGPPRRGGADRAHHATGGAAQAGRGTGGAPRWRWPPPTRNAMSGSCVMQPRMPNLSTPSGLGGFGWLAQTVGMPLPAPLAAEAPDQVSSRDHDGHGRSAERGRRHSGPTLRAEAVS